MGRRIKRSAAKKTRVSTDFTEGELTRISDILTGPESTFSTKAAVIKAGIKLLHWFLKRLGDGDRVFVGKDRNSAVEVVFPTM